MMDFSKNISNIQKKHLYKINVENPLLATLVEPLAVCLHSLELADFKFGMTAYIAGAGGIGASLLYLLKKIWSF